MDEQFTGIFIPVKYRENKGYIEARPSPNMSTGWYRIRSLK